jgi:transposase
VFYGNVRELLTGNNDLAAIILPLLEAWRDIRKRTADLDRELLAAARQSQSTRLLMTIPGIGAITGRYQSGEVDHDGHISRRGDNHLRGLLYEAASVILTRTSSRNESSLKSWGLNLRERLGFKRAAVAVARKLAVIMHSMLRTGEVVVFNASAGATA